MKLAVTICTDHDALLDLFQNGRSVPSCHQDGYRLLLQGLVWVMVVQTTRISLTAVTTTRVCLQAINQVLEFLAKLRRALRGLPPNPTHVITVVELDSSYVA